MTRCWTKCQMQKLARAVKKKRGGDDFWSLMLNMAYVSDQLDEVQRRTEHRREEQQDRHRPTHWENLLERPQVLTCNLSTTIQATDECRETKHTKPAVVSKGV